MAALRRFASLTFVTLACAAAISGCKGPDPTIVYLDAESGLSLSHPPKWTMGAAADAAGVGYRYITAPKLAGDTDTLSVTLISPAPGGSVEAIAQPYLTGASTVSAKAVTGGAMEWSFKDSSGLPSRLRVIPVGDGRFTGAWARGPEKAMKEYSSAVDSILISLTVEKPSTWPEERFAGMIVRVPASWTKGSRLSSATNASMQLKSPPLATEKANATIHGFATLSKEPATDLASFAKMLRERETDIAVRTDRVDWPEVPGVNRPAGFRDLLRSGNSLTSTRIRRWISVRNGVGLIFSCEAKSDAFDLLDPWCERMSATVRFE
jgi:hypothetical protein